MLGVLIHSLNAHLPSVEECSQFLSLMPSDSSCLIIVCNLKGSGSLFPGSFSVFPWVVSRCFFREVGAVFNVDSLPGVFKVFFKDLGLFGGLSFNFDCFRVFHSLKTCPWLCIFILKDFVVSILWCFIYQLLLLFASNIVVFLLCRASVLVITCLVTVYMSSSCFLRG